MKQVVTTAGAVLLLLFVIVLAEVPLVREAAAWIDVRRTPLLLGVAGVLALAFVLFFGGILKLLMDRGEPLTHDEAAGVRGSVNLAARPVFARATRYRVAGRAVGSGGSDSFNLRDLKAAIRSGAVWRDAVWRRRAVTTVGALLFVAGILAVLVVIGPPWLKVLGVALFSFVLVQLARGWLRAQPAR